MSSKIMPASSEREFREALGELYSLVKLIFGIANMNSGT